MRRSFVVLCVLMTALLGGCGMRPYGVDYFATDNRPYTLGSGDRLRIIVFGQDSLSNTYSVDASGNISMPLIGLVHAAGSTTAALERHIEAKLRGGFLREPKVSAEVEAFRPFFILGEVTLPGQYPYVSGMTVQTAVAIAGGFTPRGYSGNADLTRTVDAKAYTAPVPITQPVQPGDTIVIRERFF
ncbi:MAG: polysaccharide export protein [Methylobacteriaceae bacterium]|nr:polysaccharide export protein [Methylobacteriaceae bacterium]